MPERDALRPRENCGEVDREVAVLTAFRDATGSGRVATPHVQAQREIDRIRVHDEVGDGKYEDREADGPSIGH